MADNQNNASAPSATPTNKTFFNGSEESLDTTLSMARFRKGPIGESGLIRYNGRIYDESRDELRFPESIRTYNKMSYDSTINAARNVFGMFVRKTNISAKPKEGQEKNKKAKNNADFVNWQLENFERSWRQIITDVMTYDLYGFSIQEMIFDIPKEGKYSAQEKDISSTAYTVEPNQEAVLNTIFPQLVQIMVYHALLESKASEHSARMVAMKNATDKSKEMVRSLTLIFNKERQAAITAEVSEITGGIEAMK